MPEPALSMQLSDFRKGLGHWLGFGRGLTSAWTAAQLEDIDAYIDGGYRQFLSPPILPDEKRSHSWSFITPLTTLTTVASTADLAMPDDCAALIGNMTFDGDTYAGSVRFVHEEALRSMQQGNGDATGKPEFYTVRMNTTTGNIGQRGTISFYPTPDAAYTLTVERQWIMLPLSDAHPWPLGGAKHADTIMQSILAFAENRRDGIEGIETKRFFNRLAVSVSLDRELQPDVIGYNGDRSDNHFVDPRYRPRNDHVTYNGVHYGV